MLLNEILALVRDGELADDDNEETLATFTSRGLASVHDDHVCKVGIASISYFKPYLFEQPKA
jgi:hypothetical protein